MDLSDLTLLIPAKFEKESIPIVIKYLDKLNCKKLIVLAADDTETIDATKNLNCEILFQKKPGYGSALIEGINNINTEYLCIFNADGSFDYNDIGKMFILAKSYNFVFASRYLDEKSGSDDDTFLTFLGNKFFSYLCNILFNIKLSDILYTYILGSTQKFKECKLNSEDFRICVELPLKIKAYGFSYLSTSSFERKRLFGKKKVKEFIDGYLILYYILTFFFKRK